MFDMDGTLLVGSACFEISREVGVLEETLEIERRWANGDLSDNGFWEHCLPLWADLSDEQIERAFLTTQWLPGVREVFADIAARGEHSVVITQSPQFFVERIKRWGASHAHGALVVPGNAAGAERLVSSEEKLEVAEELLGTLGLSREHCVAYGDSASDLTLFQTLRHTVAVNANDRIRSLAKVAYDGDNLWEAYLAGRELLERCSV